MTDTPPDRLASDPRSPFYDADVIDRGVGIRFNGVERDNVEGILHQRRLGAGAGGQVQGPPRQSDDPQGQGQRGSVLPLSHRQLTAGAPCRTRVAQSGPARTAPEDA